MNRSDVTCPVCQGKVHISEECKTSYPCIHKATCLDCDHRFKLYGIHCSCDVEGRFYYDWKGAFFAPAK